MLLPLNDHPIHQTSAPLEQPSSGDPNVYDRFFFNGYAEHVYFGVAMGLYPNRFIADAAFSVVVDGEQVSVHASRASTTRDTEVGPISVEIVEPMRVLRVKVTGDVEADLTYTARTQPVLEPPFLRMAGSRVVFDYTRFTQWGRWTGHIVVDGRRIEVDQVLGSRDRSWGVRPIGERMPGPMMGAPQFFWLWAPISFPTYATHFDVNEESDGTPWHSSGFYVPEAADPVVADAVDWRITWRPGTRRADAFEYDLHVAERTLTVRLEPFLDFQMLGIGYLHPEWGHGFWKGDLAVETERWNLADLDPGQLHHLHVQQLCRATCGDDEGIGILEVLALGPHASGLEGLIEGFSGGS